MAFLPGILSRNRMKPTKFLLALAAGLGLALTSMSFARDIYYVSDYLATTVATIDVAGEIAQMEADAFGTPLSHDGNAGNPTRYTGKPYDEDLGAYVFPFRNYRSEEGRWMSADPSGFPDGINTYGYCEDIFNAVDPDGLASVKIAGFEIDFGNIQLQDGKLSVTLEKKVPGSEFTNSTLQAVDVEYSFSGTASISGKVAGVGVSIDPTISMSFSVNVPVEYKSYVLAKIEVGMGSGGPYVSFIGVRAVVTE